LVGLPLGNGAKALRCRWRERNLIGPDADANVITSNKIRDLNRPLELQRDRRQHDRVYDPLTTTLGTQYGSLANAATTTSAGLPSLVCR
jgi:hypothetical protein